MSRVLIVDDEAIECSAMKRIIEDNCPLAGSVLVAHTGPDAMRMIDESEFDIVFLDVKIPGVNGLDVCEYLKGKYPDCHVVITTAYGVFEFAFRAIKVRVNDYLLKPVRPEKIIECVNAALRHDADIAPAQKGEQYLDELSKYLQAHSYRETIACLQTALDKIYQTTTDLGTISCLVLNIGNRIAETAMFMGLDLEAKHQYQISCLKERFAPYDNRLDIYHKLLSMTDVVFDALESSPKYDRTSFTTILNFIERNIGKNITLSDVAAHVNISTYYLSKIFKREMDINFITYLVDRRVELAKAMLTGTEKPIMNIAMELSFHESNYFSRVFKKKTGLTPSEYREREREKQALSLKRGGRDSAAHGRDYSDSVASAMSMSPQQG